MKVALTGMEACGAYDVDPRGRGGVSESTYSHYRPNPLSLDDKESLAAFNFRFSD